MCQEWIFPSGAAGEAGRVLIKASLGRRPASDARLGSAGGLKSRRIPRPAQAEQGRSRERKGRPSSLSIAIPALPMQQGSEDMQPVFWGLRVLWGRLENPAVNPSPGSRTGEGFCGSISTWALSGGRAKKVVPLGS